MIREPTQVISAIADDVRTGARKPAQRTKRPWKPKTNAAANKTPIPSLAASMEDENRSSNDLVYSRLLSPEIPAFKEPLMVMAPTQNNRLAVTKPSVMET